MPAMKRVHLSCAVLAILGGACGSDSMSDPDATVADAARPADAAPDAAPDAVPPPDASIFPATLEESGLYSDFAGRVIADDILEYTPAYELWSDGAAKRRWVYLPQGTTIDTTDMDFWVYPEGTKLWKEFSDGGTLLETRLLWKTGPNAGDWYYVSFAWNQAQTEALAAPDGVENTLGTEFDIPEDRDCRKCHERQPDYVLGFSAIQLAHQNAGVNLDSLIADGRLSVNPIGTSPYFPVPGTGVEQQMLGYFHGNCGGCHHRDSDVMDTTSLNLRLEVATLATVEETTSYSTIVDVPNQLVMPGVTALIEPGDVDASSIYVRMNARGTLSQMPEIGTEVIDSDAVAALTQWIADLAP